MSNIVIVGAGGLGREVLEIFNAQGRVHEIGYFIDDDESLQGKIIAHGTRVSGTTKASRKVRHIIAVGNNKVRKEIVFRIDERMFWNAIHPSIIIPSCFRIAVGSDVIISAGVIFTEPSIRIGDHIHIDTGCTISHNVALGDYVRLNPGVTVCGNVTIEEGAYIGAGSTIKEGVRIGAWSTVGMGSVVLNDVLANTTVYGVPAK